MWYWLDMLGEYCGVMGGMEVVWFNVRERRERAAAGMCEM
jgi:hypothetical protein